MKISSKIALSNIVLGTSCVFAVLATVVVQHRHLQREAGEMSRRTAEDQAKQVTQTLLANCRATEQRNVRRLDHSLGVARAMLESKGSVTFGTESEGWNAINQFSKETQEVSLPVVLLGGKRLEPCLDTKVPVPVVDDTTRMTREFCTIFQRMNEAGDMLRVATSVIKTDGSRAIGTYIPARNPDGSENAVVKTVLRGDTYRGRAYVVNDWHATVYEPIWDEAKSRVMGMLYVGIGLKDINRDLRESIVQTRLGKTGCVSVFGAKGDLRGRYVVSPGGVRDGEDRLEAKDSEGSAWVHSVLTASMEAGEGQVPLVRYGATEASDPVSGARVAAVAYFAPWDWVLCAEAREADFAGLVAHLSAAQRTQILTALVVVMVVGSFGFVMSLYLGRSIARPIAHAVSTLGSSTEQIIFAAEHLTRSSNSLAECANDHAASSEETSASLSELAGTTRRNAESAGRANEIARVARQVTDQSAADVGQLKAAMSDIEASGREISKIIQTIDEIAFQTNILALNAAVEAARAGSAGMGFGVVADEVRSLAQRSAEAARETAAKIEAAIAGTARGVAVSEKVAQSLEAIHSSIRQVDGLVGEVSSASVDQKESVAQIETAVSQMDKLTQRTANGAEESATASEELQAQATMLRDELNRLAELIHSRAEFTGPIPTRSGPGRMPAEEAGTQTRAHPRTVAAPEGKPPAASAVARTECDSRSESHEALRTF